MTKIAISFADAEVKFSLPEQDAGRILSAFTQMWATQGVDDKGEPTVILPPVQEVVLKIAQSVVEGLAQQALRFEQDTAATAARKDITPIEYTITP
jgi:hypothetical protein